MGVNLRTELINASRIHFEAHIEKHRINVENLLQNSVGIGEHPQHLEEVNKQIEKIANAKEKLQVLDEFEPAKGTAL